MTGILLFEYRKAITRPARAKFLINAEANAPDVTAVHNRFSFSSAVRGQTEEEAR